MFLEILKTFRYSKNPVYICGARQLIYGYNQLWTFEGIYRKAS